MVPAKYLGCFDVTKRLGIPVVPSTLAHSKIYLAESSRYEGADGGVVPVVVVEIAIDGLKTLLYEAVLIEATSSAKYTQVNFNGGLVLKSLIQNSAKVTVDIHETARFTDIEDGKIYLILSQLSSKLNIESFELTPAACQ
jgi:hypothetical protein